MMLESWSLKWRDRGGPTDMAGPMALIRGTGMVNPVDTVLGVAVVVEVQTVMADGGWAVPATGQA